MPVKDPNEVEEEEHEEETMDLLPQSDSVI